jgi:hypothetical protein
MGPYAGVDYNLTLCPLQSQLQHIYHRRPYARIDLNPLPESTLSPSQRLWIWPLYFVTVVIVYSERKKNWQCSMFKKSTVCLPVHGVKPKEKDAANNQDL